jgi:chromosome partitioning protein
MTKVIAISNNKGGVGKTTSAVNLAAALNLSKKKVLVIDLDPQSNLSQSLGVFEAEKNLYGAIMKHYEMEPIEVLKNFHLVPATEKLSRAETDLSTKYDGNQFYLKEAIENIKDSYDYVIIDCPPSLGLLTINAFTAADEILIPLQSEYLATQGLTNLVEVVQTMKKRLNPSLIIGGVFLTQYDSRKNLNKDILNAIQEHFKDELLDTKIRDNVSLAEAPAHELDIFRYNSKSFGAEDYKQLAKEIIKRHLKWQKTEKTLQTE